MPKQKRTSLVTGALLSWGSKGLYAATAFILTPFIIGALGKPGFGMWALIQSFSGYYGLINLGLGSALQRFISRDLSLADNQSLQRTVSAAAGFFTFSGLLIMTAAVLLAEPAAVFFEIASERGEMFTDVVILCAFAVVTDFYGALFSTMLTSRERFDLSNGLGMARQLIQTVGIVIALNISPSLYSLALVVCVVSVVSQVVTLAVVKRLYPGLSILGSRPSLARIRELLYFGTSTVLITISNMIRLRIGNAVLAKTTGFEAVALFNLATTIVQQMNSTVATSLSVLNPRLTHLHTQGQLAELQRLFRNTLFISAAMSCLFATIIFIFGERFIVFWVGPTFLPSAAVMHVLTLGYVFALAQNPSWNLMFALARHHFMARLTIVEAFAVIGLGFWLSARYGALGFAWATTGLMIVSKLFIHAPYSARVASMNLSAYLQPMLYPFAVGGTLVGLAHVLHLNAFLRDHGPIVFVGALVLVVGTFGGTLFLASRRRDYFPEAILRKFTNHPRMPAFVRRLAP